MELSRVGAGDPVPGRCRCSDIPGLGFVAPGGVDGVPATRATTAEEFHLVQPEAAIAVDGPALVEAVVPAPSEASCRPGPRAPT